ncbi:hypothetical protein BGZ99_001381 [Dissophora globulifera]|uniref:Auxin efflux carrier n=1 Tax=Dissophora globulifera TaxID=979702 RepID=A0A9P6R0N5_9FUNG|nr:hypothetical protein BGZ99_001381 [Dissophora globulifera]
MTPCLLFTKIASTINWTQFKAFWPIPVFYVLFSAMSWVVAKVGSRILRFSKDEENFVIASVLFSNTNSLPMALIQSLAFSAAGDRLLRDENDTKEDVAARGISYVLFYAIFGNLLRWSYGFTLLVPQTKASDEESNLPAPSVQINIDTPTSSEHPTAHIPVKTSTFVPVSSTHLHPSSASHPRSPAVSVKSVAESVLMRAASTAYERVRRVLTPPLVTALMALLIGLVPALHQLFMSPESTVYRFLVRPIESCGASAIPMILLCLGAQVVHFASTSPKSPKTSAAAVIKAGKRKLKSLHPHASTSTAPTGLGILTNNQDDLSSDDEESNAHHFPDPRDATTRSSVSSSATLLQYGRPSDLAAGGQRCPTQPATHPTTGFSGESAENSDDDDSDELQPLLNSTEAVDRSHRVCHWISPVSFSLIARMVLVPAVCLPAIIFHPETLSPILTMDPTFSLALVLIVAAPTAINLIQMCQIEGFYENEMASVLFWSYCVFGIPCVLGWSLVGLWAANQK